MAWLTPCSSIIMGLATSSQRTAFCPGLCGPSSAGAAGVSACALAAVDRRRLRKYSYRAALRPDLRMARVGFGHSISRARYHLGIPLRLACAGRHACVGVLRSYDRAADLQHVAGVLAGNLAASGLGSDDVGRGLLRRVRRTSGSHHVAFGIHRTAAALFRAGVVSLLGGVFRTAPRAVVYGIVSGIVPGAVVEGIGCDSGCAAGAAA